MSGDPEQEYFSDGISEDIITALSKLRWFFVIARNSSFIYKGKSVHLKQIAGDLGVRYVLEGSVRKGGDRVRITAQLNDVATGSHLWAERYDRDLADVFAVQDEITEAIVAAIEPQLYAAENFRAQRKAPDSMDAWDLVMRALSHYWRVTRQDNVVAQALLEKAIAIDPNYGQALGVLAMSYIFTAHMGWAEWQRLNSAAERAALAAIRTDSEDPWAHAALGHIYLLARRFDDSLAEYELALRLNPNFSLAQAFYGVSLCYSGRWQEGDEAARRALRLSPRDPFRRSITASPPTPSSWAATMTKRSGSRASRCATRRLCRRTSRADRRRRHGGTKGCFKGCAFGTPPRPAEYLAGLDRRAHADPARRRPRALSGRLSPRRAGLMSGAIPPNLLQNGQKYVQNSAMLDRRDLEPVFFAPFVSSRDEGRAGVDRLQRPSQHGLLQRAVRPRGGRGVRTARLRRRLCEKGIFHLHRRGARALPARVERGRPGAGHLPIARLRLKAHALFRAAFSRRGRLGVGHLGEHVAACRHGGEEDRAVPDRGDAAADPDEGRARPVAAAGSSRTQRGDAGQSKRAQYTDHNPGVASSSRWPSDRGNRCCGRRATRRSRLRSQRRATPDAVSHCSSSSLPMAKATCSGPRRRGREWCRPAWSRSASRCRA